MNNIKDLAKSKVFGYISAVLYMIGFIFLVFEYTITYILIFVICFVLIVMRIVYDWKFIVKTLKGDKK